MFRRRATLERRLPALCDTVGRFRRADAGVAAIEFAFLLPVMLLIYVYLVDFSRAFDEKRKEDKLASTITDLISQQPTGKPITSSTVGSVLGASAPLMAPFNPSAVTASVSVIQLTSRSDHSCCDVTVAWSFTQGGSLRPCGTVLTQVPASTSPQPINVLADVVGKNPRPGELIVTDVHASFQPIFSPLMSFFAQGFQRTYYMSPRRSGQLLLQSPPSPQQGQQAQICS